MSYLFLKKFYKAKWGENERKLSLHCTDDNLAEQIAQGFNNELNAMKSKTKVVPTFKLNKRGHFIAKMNHEFNKHYSEDFYVRCFNVLLKFGYKLDKQYDEQPIAGSYKEVFVFLKIN